MCGRKIAEDSKVVKKLIGFRKSFTILGDISIIPHPHATSSNEFNAFISD